MFLIDATYVLLYCNRVLVRVFVTVAARIHAVFLFQSLYRLETKCLGLKV